MLKSTRKKFIAGGAAAFLTGATLLYGARAAHRGAGFGFGGGHHRFFAGFIADYLDLSETQREQAKTILQQARGSVMPVVAQLKQVHEAMEEVSKAGATESEIRTMADQQARLISQLMVEGFRAKRDLYMILTAEQQAKADKLHERFRGMRQERWEQFLSNENFDL